jgi:hypothetical protein
MTMICFSNFAQNKNEKSIMIQIPSEKDSVIKYMQGSWFGIEYEEHAVFTVKGDIMMDVEHFEKHKYGISNDTLCIRTGNTVYRELILKLTLDSLIVKELETPNIYKYWHSKWK